VMSFIPEWIAAATSAADRVHCQPDGTRVGVVFDAAPQKPEEIGINDTAMTPI